MILVLGWILVSVLYKLFLVLCGGLLIYAFWKPIIAIASVFIFGGILAGQYYYTNLELKEKYRMRKKDAFSNAWLTILILEEITIVLSCSTSLAFDNLPFLPLLISGIIYISWSRYIVSSKCKQLDQEIARRKEILRKSKITEKKRVKVRSKGQWL